MESIGRRGTEWLNVSLEGIVLAVLAPRRAFCFEINAWLREGGFTDIVEGTVVALLILVEHRARRRRVGPFQEVPNAQTAHHQPRGREHLAISGGRRASSQVNWTRSDEQATEMDISNMTAKVVCDDPAAFVDALVANCAKGGHVPRERQQLDNAIARAEAGGAASSTA